MSAKAILVLSAQALLAHVAFSQCTSRAAIDASDYSYSAPGLAYNGLTAPAKAYDANWAGRGYACDGIYPTMDFTPTSGGGLAVTSASAIAPTGISVVSENAFEGVLNVAGELPFVGTTTVDGTLATAGAGAINHACGNGVTAMASETAAFAPATPASAISPAADIAPATISPAAPYTPGLGLGLGNRFGYRGCGSRGLMY